MSYNQPDKNDVTIFIRTESKQFGIHKILWKAWKKPNLKPLKLAAGELTYSLAKHYHQKEWNSKKDFEQNWPLLFSQ